MSTPLPLPQPSRPSQMRCADSDRDLVAEVLNAAFAEGRITQDEHSERMDALWQAKTFGELTPLTEDLMPHGPIHHLPAPVNGQGAGLVVDPSNAHQNPDSITCVMGDVKRQGHWRLRRRTTGLVLMGDVKLDLTEAVMEAAECTIAIPCIMGDVTITVPDGVNVRNETTTILGDTKIRGLAPAPAGAPTIVLRGMVLMGDVKVNGPGFVPLTKRLGLTS